MKIVFAGTPPFAAAALQALITSSHDVIAVYTQPDRPSGRGRHLQASAVKELALQHNLPIYQPVSLRDAVAQQVLSVFEADVMIVAAYGLILPPAVLTLPKLGCINIHASLLPRWRGAAPIQRAILAGDRETGVTIMQMDAGLDTGDVLYKIPCSIGRQDTSERLHQKLADLGAKAILAVLDKFSDIKAEKQNNTEAVYAHKISKDEAKCDWALPAEELERKVRAFIPWPIAYTQCEEKTVRIWEACVVEQEVTGCSMGQILQANAKGIDVVTGKNILRLLKLQLPNGRVLTAGEIVNHPKTIFQLGVKFK